MAIEYAIIIKNKTRLETLTGRFNTLAQARFYIERMGGEFRDYEMEHEQFHDSLSQVQSSLSGILKNKIVEREYVPSYLFADNNLIVVIGQDGLVANTAKYSNGVPIIAINPDPERYDGVLLPFSPYDFIDAVEDTVAGTQDCHEVRFAEARMNDGQRLLAFNDLFIGAKTHVSARYRISFLGNTEEHSSSGLIVSTPAGSTGWLSSVFNMASGILNFSTEEVEEEDQSIIRPGIPDGQLLFAVREPFLSVKTQISLCAGVLDVNARLQIESLMPSNGVIFSDGVERDFLKFNSGSIVVIGPTEETAKLVIKKR